MKCATCIKSKMKKLPFENNREKTMEILQVVHTDLNGPQPIVGYKGGRYFLSFVDDFTKNAREFIVSKVNRKPQIVLKITLILLKISSENRSRDCSAIEALSI